MISHYRFVATILLVISILLTLTLPAAAQTWKIMPVGNSITAGVGDDDANGYRDDLYDLLRDAGLDFQFVGPDGTAPYKGHFESGRKIEEFTAGGIKDVGPSMDNYQPDILLVHLGTNNMNKDDARTAGLKLESLLNYILTWPNTKRILVCKIIPRLSNGGTSDPRVAEYNAEIERLFFEHYNSSTWDKVTLVNMYYLFDPPSYTNLPDGTHPNSAGYAKMAREYYDVLNQIIRQYPNDGGEPARITLRGGAYGTTAQVSWTAVGDNNNNEGQANLYELRYGASELTADNFSSATLLSLSKPQPSGTEESILVPNLVPGLTYHFMIRAYDEWNNRGTLSDDYPVDIPPPTIEYCTDFCQAPPLPDWVLNSSYTVANCQLSISSAPNGWNYLGVYNGVSYTSNAKYVETSLHWSSSDDVEGINGSGIAMMLDNPSSTANGYLIKVRYNTISLFEIKNGSTNNSLLMQTNPTAVGADPQPDDTLRVRYSFSSTQGYVFNAYLNRNWIGSVNDSAMRQGHVSRLYSGVMLYGGYNNNIDAFCVAVPPLDADSMKIFAGNYQHGPIAQKLLTPLSVKVVDVNNNAVPNVPVGFSISSGEGSLSTHPDSLQFNGNLWVEAESGDVQPPMQSGGDSQASDQEYVYVNPATGSNGKGVASYKVYVPRTGTYKLWIRYIAPDEGKNSCSFSVAGSDTFDWTPLSLTSSWAWISKTPNSFNLNAGFIDFAIKNRESGTKIDKILLTTNSYTPSGTGGTTQPFSFITDASGVAYTFLTFGTQAGLVQVTAEAQVPHGSPLTFQEYAEAGDPVRMEYASNSIMSGPAGQILSEPFAVQLFDQYDNKCSGVSVDFVIVNGGDGHFSDQDSIRVASDSTGIAGARLTLGYSGTNVEARLPDFPNITPLLFKASPNANIPSRIDTLAGTQHVATVHHALPNPLMVRVVDAEENPVVGFPVLFTVVRGGFLNSSAKSVIDSTDTEGIASVTITLGDTAGIHNNVVSVEAKLGKVHLNNSPLEFKASAVPDTPNSLIKISGEPQSWYAGETFPQPLVVKVSDQYGNGIKDHDVEFGVQTGTGNFDGQVTTTAGPHRTVQTDTTGKAQVSYTAGSATGTNQIKVDAGIAGAQTFSLTVNPARPSKLTKISGDNPVQQATVGTKLTNAFKVRVTDPFDVYKPGVSITFRVESGGGKFDNGLDSLIATTSSNGEAQAFLTLGTVAGFQNQQVQVLSRPYPSIAPVTFVASALTGDAAKLAAASDTAFSDTADTGPVSLSVKVMDQYDNPKQGYSITFGITAGDGRFDNGNAAVTDTSNDSGIATAKYFMGTSTSEENVIYASSTNGTYLDGGPVKFTGTVLPKPPAGLEPLAASMNQAGRILEPLPLPLTVTVQDEYRNPVPSIPVHFQVLSQGGAIDGNPEAEPTTDPYGQASVSYTLGTKAGSNSDTVKVTVRGFVQIQPVFFYASAEAGDPAKSIIDGDSVWTNIPVKSTITPRVEVMDRHGNAVAGARVRFRVEDGGGTVASKPDTASSLTNGSGICSITWVVGQTPDTNKVQATLLQNGSPISGSYHQFLAITRAGEPRYLIRVGPQEISGVIDQPLDLTAKVIDASDNPIASHPVGFVLKKGQGEFTPPNGQVLTNEHGLARISFKPKGQPGMLSHAIQCSSKYNGIDLYDKQNAYVNFLINTTREQFADKIGVISPNSKTFNTTAGSTTTVQVKAESTSGAAVAGQMISFAALDSTGGYLAGSPGQDSVDLYTNDSGIAETTWMVGTLAGKTSRLAISATTQQGSHLKGSPDTLKASIIPGPPARNHSKIAFTDLPYVKEDLLVTVTVADTFNNPIAGIQVELASEDTSLKVIQQPPVTDAKGQAIGSVRSSQIGTKRLFAKIKATDKTIASRDISFSVGLLDKLLPISGSPQGNVGTLLSDSLAVKAVDRNDFALANVVVEFTTAEASGALFLESQQPSYIDTTNAKGIASAHFILGTNQGPYVAAAKADGKETTFVVTAFTPTNPKKLEIVAGNAQPGRRDSILSDSFVVEVTDYNNRIVWNEPVTFRPLNGGEIIGQNPARTNYRGQASVQYRVGSGPIDSVEAKLTNGQEVVFTANVEQEKPDSLKLISGSGQRGTINTELVYPIVVKVVGKSGNGISGKEVTFLPMNDPTRRKRELTDDSGLAQYRWTIGNSTSPNGNTLNVISSNLAGLTVTATGVSNNFPVFVGLPSDTTVAAGQLLEIEIKAEDKDAADQNRLVYQIKDLPHGSRFDSSTQVFSWTPTPQDQEGIWMLHLRVEDNKTGNERGFDVDSIRITVTPETIVELSNFEGSVAPYKGIVLNWKTNQEFDNLGFDVLRSFSENGPYHKINSGLVKSQAEGKYSFTDSAVVAGRKYYYKLEDINNNGVRTPHGPVVVELPLPDKFQLLQNYPNPFNPRTTIRFQLPKAAATRISIYNMLGQEVKRIVDRPMEPGYHEVLWDGRNEAGTQVGSGVYYYRIEAGEFRDTKKMALLR